MGCGASNIAHVAPLDSKYNAPVEGVHLSPAKVRPEGYTTPDATPISSQRLTDVNIKPLVDQNVRFEEKVHEIISAPGSVEEIVRVECQHCHRKFAEARIEQHQKVCAQPKKAREVWDDEKKRVEGTVFAEVRPKTPSNAAANQMRRQNLRTPSRQVGQEQGL